MKFSMKFHVFLKEIALLQEEDVYGSSMGSREKMENVLESLSAYYHISCRARWRIFWSVFKSSLRKMYSNFSWNWIHESPDSWQSRKTCARCAHSKEWLMAVKPFTLLIPGNREKLAPTVRILRSDWWLASRLKEWLMAAGADWWQSAPIDGNQTLIDGNRAVWRSDWWQSA